MSYANLSGISKGQCNTIMRDIVEFERFGITAETVAAFRSQVEVLDNTPKDEELRGVVITLTAVKNEQAEQVKTLIREIALFVKQVYKQNSGVYSALDIYDLSKKTDNDLHRSAISVVRTMRTMANDFEPEVQNVANELETVNLNWHKSY